MDPESVDVTAGLGGFLAFFLLAVALYFLMRNMNARMRRMAYREEQEAKAAADEGPDSDGSDSPGATDGPDLG
jgi:large-conductance mechanosensitive channel